MKHMEEIAPKAALALQPTEGETIEQLAKKLEEKLL